ncbi:MAG: DUF6115 domain-containing protein [Calditrichota bacterium]
MKRTILSFFIVGNLLCAGFLMAGKGQPVLLDLRVGPHKSFDRVVFEFPSEVTHEITKSGENTIQIRFKNARANEGFSVPTMPRGLTVLSGIKIQSQSGSELVFDITLNRDATPTELPLVGNTWRLAMDFAPRIAEESQEKPEYIPGDLPIPTTYAENDVPTVDSLETVDPAQSHAILTYFFFSRGDTEQAAREAQRYQDLTGQMIPMSPTPESAPTTDLSKEHPLQQAKSFKIFMLPLPAVLGITFGLGLLVGLIALRLLPVVRFQIRLPRLKLRLPKRQPKPVSEPGDLSDELEEDLSLLDSAVKQEPKRTKAAAPPEPEPVMDEVPDAEKEAKDSLMDRRVRRVLELNKEGRSVSDIAEELEMGQDEVKLILDLNR